MIVDGWNLAGLDETITLARNNQPFCLPNAFYINYNNEYDEFDDDDFIYESHFSLNENRLSFVRDDEQNQCIVFFESFDTYDPNTKQRIVSESKILGKWMTDVREPINIILQKVDPNLIYEYCGETKNGFLLKPERSTLPGGSIRTWCNENPAYFSQ